MGGAVPAIGAAGEQVVVAIVLEHSRGFAAVVADDAGGELGRVGLVSLGGKAGVVLVQQRDIEFGVHLAGVDDISVIGTIVVLVHAGIHKDGHVAGFAQAVGVQANIVVHAGNVLHREGAERAVAGSDADHSAAVAAGRAIANAATLYPVVQLFGIVQRAIGVPDEHELLGALVIDHLGALGDAVVAVQGLESQLQAGGGHVAHLFIGAVRVEQAAGRDGVLIIALGGPADVVQVLGGRLVLGYIGAQEVLDVAELALGHAVRCGGQLAPGFQGFQVRLAELHDVVFLGGAGTVGTITGVDGLFGAFLNGQDGALGVEDGAVVGPVVQVGGAVAAHTVHRAGAVGLILAEPEVNGLALGDGTVAVQVVVDTAVADALFQGHGRAAVGLHGQTGVGLNDGSSGAGDVGVGFGQGAQALVLGGQGAGAVVQFLVGRVLVFGKFLGRFQGFFQGRQGVNGASLVAGVLPGFQLLGGVVDAVCLVGCQGGADLLDLGSQLGAGCVGGGGAGLAVDSQPADNGGLVASGGDGVVNGLLLIQGEVCLIDDIAAAAGEVQGGGIAQGFVVRIGDHSGHRAVVAPPFVVGTGQGIGTGGQGQGVGQGLACCVVFAVDAGSGLIGGAAVALGACIGIHQAPGSGIGLKLVEGLVQQLVAQCLFIDFIHIGRAAGHIGDLTGNRIDEVKGIAGDDFFDSHNSGKRVTQRVDDSLYGAVDRNAAVGFGCQCIRIGIPLHGQALNRTIAHFDLDRGRQFVHGAASQIVIPVGQLGQDADCNIVSRSLAGTDGVQCINCEGAGLEFDLDGVLASGQISQDVSFAAEGRRLGGGILCFQLAVHIDIDDSGAIVFAHDGKAIAIDGEDNGRTGSAGGRNGAVPVIGTAAAGVVDSPIPLVRDGIVLAVDHGGGIGDAALDGFDFQVVGVDLLPVGADLDTAGEHGGCIGVAGNSHVIDVGVDGVAQADEFQVILTLGVLSYGAVGDLGASAEQLPTARAVDLQRVAAAGPVHAGLGTNGQALVTAGISVGQGDIDGSAVIHPAPVAHDGGRLAASPLVDTGTIFLLKLAVLNDPGTVGIQHIAGLVAAGGQVRHLGSFTVGAGNTIHTVLLHIAFLFIVEVIGIEVVIGGIGIFAGGVGIQHSALLGLDVIAVVVLFGGEAGGRSIQRSSGHNAVGRHGDISNAVFDGGRLARLQVVIGLGGPDVQSIHRDVHVVCNLDSKGLFVLGVVDEHRGEILLIRRGQGHVAGVAIDAGSSVLVVVGTERGKGCIGQHAPDAVGVGLVLPAGLGKLGDVGQHIESGVIVDIAAPGVTGGEQFLMAVLDALVESTDGGLEHVQGAAGANERIGEAVQQGQRALIAADGACAVRSGFILLQFAVAEGGAALAVPDFLVVHIGHLDVVAGGGSTVVEADSIHSIVQFLIVEHLRNDIQCLVLVRSNDLDVVVSGNGFVSEVVGELILILQCVGKVLDDLAIGVLGLVLIGVDIVNDIAVLLVSIKDSLFVPLIDSGVLFLGGGFVRDPVGILPPQDGDLDVGVDLFSIGCHDEAGGTGSIGFLILVTHGAGIGTGGVVAIVAHLHLDVGEQRVTVIAAKEILHHGPVGLRVLGLVVQQQVAGGVAVEQAKALVGPAVFVLGGGLDLGAVQGNNTIHIRNISQGFLAGGSLGLSGFGLGGLGHNDVIVQAGAHKAGAKGSAECADDAGLFAEFEAHAGGGQDFLAVQVDGNGALGIVLVINEGEGVPLPCFQALGEFVLFIVVDCQHSGAIVLAGDDAEVGICRRANQNGRGVIVGIVELDVRIQGEAAALEEAVSILNSAAAVHSGVAAGNPAGGDADPLARGKATRQGCTGADGDEVVILQRFAEVFVLIRGIRGLHIAGALNSQPADGGGVGAGGGSGPGHDLVGGDGELAGLDGDVAVVLLRHSGVDARAIGGGQAQVHGAVLAAPPLTVGGGDGILTGRQGEVIGDGFAFFVVFSVDAGVGLISDLRHTADNIALGLGIGIHQAPSGIALVELVELVVQQLVAQQGLGSVVGFGSLYIGHDSVVLVAGSSHAVNKVDGIRRDDLNGVGDTILCDLHGLKGGLEGILGDALHALQRSGHFANRSSNVSGGHSGIRGFTLLGGSIRCRSLGFLFGRCFGRGRGLLCRSFGGCGRFFRRGLCRGRGLLGIRICNRGVCVSRGLLLLDDGRCRLIVGKRLGRDHASQHADTQCGRQNALTLAFCFSHVFHPLFGFQRANGYICSGLLT